MPENIVLSQVPAEDSFTSQDSTHILVEDGGTIKRLNSTAIKGLSGLPTATAQDNGKIPVANINNTYSLESLNTNNVVKFYDVENPSVDKTEDEMGQIIGDYINFEKSAIVCYDESDFGRNKIYTLPNVSVFISRISFDFEICASGIFFVEVESIDGVSYFKYKSIMCSWKISTSDPEISININDIYIRADNENSVL